MKTYKIIQPVTLTSGIVRLKDDQAKGREHKLELLGRNCYRITAPNQFKVGQVIGYDGDIPKTMANGMDEMQGKGKKNAASSGKTDADSKALEEAARADWEKSESLRAQHAGDFNAYLAAVLEQLG